MTITEIAAKAGVSIGTVDRVIHNRGHVSPEKRKIIEEVIATYGYKPNPIAKQLKMHRQFVIGVLIPNLESEIGYWNLVYNGIKKAVDELSPFSVSIILADFERTRYGSMLESGKILLDKKVDALIIAPNRQKETLQFLNSGVNIPYVFVDSPLPDANPVAAVAQNPYRSGFCAGRLMKMLCPNAKKLLTIQIHENTYNLKVRTVGFSAYFKQEIYAPDDVTIIDLIHNESDGSDRDFIVRAMEQCPDPDGVFVTNDGAYLVAEYIKSHPTHPLNSKRTIIVGYDLLPQNIQSLKNGSVDCIISQSPNRQGYDAVYTLYRKELLFQAPDTSITIPINTYFKENVEDMYVEI